MLNLIKLGEIFIIILIVVFILLLSIILKKVCWNCFCVVKVCVGKMYLKMFFCGFNMMLLLVLMIWVLLVLIFLKLICLLVKL